MIIGIPIYEKVDLLDVAGPYEVFNWMKQQVIQYYPCPPVTSTIPPAQECPLDKSG